MKNIQPKISLVFIVIAVAAFFRLIPHWPNFTPLAAIAMLGGAFVAHRALAFIIPLLAMFVSDILTVLLINYKYITVTEYFSSTGTALLYLSMIAMVGIGFLLKGKRSYVGLAGASLASAVIFFVISNFGVFLSNSLPKTWLGLIGTYELGIPFFANNLAGNLFFSFLFFGIIWKLSEQELKTQKIYIKK